MNSGYEKNSLTLAGTVAMGTGVMIGAGIFALTGQVAELSGTLFPLAFVVAAIISSAKSGLPNNVFAAVGFFERQGSISGRMDNRIG